ncbi:MAG: cell division protein FtsQ [Daejeonella sp.]
MLKQINWKSIAFTLIWLIILSGLVVLMSFIEGKKAVVKCKDVKILIPGTRNFIEREEVDRILLDNNGPLVGRNLSNINIQQIEANLKSNPFIEYAKVFADMDGIIHVQIKQREPVLRILNFANEDFYIDQNGLKIPISDNFTANVLVANGYISENFSNKIDTLKTKLGKDIFNTALFISKDTLWNDQIEQLYVNKDSEIELIPRVGNHKIILGNADSLQTKFRNLLAFYKKAMPKVGWDTYKTINIKYTNQIVCEKTNTTSTDSTKILARLLEKSVADSLKRIKQDTIKN